jgi:hypothetical protein
MRADGETLLIRLSQRSAAAGRLTFLEGSFRWKETQLPWGCESVSGMLLPGGLALDGPDSGETRPPAVTLPGHEKPPPDRCGQTG